MMKRFFPACVLFSATLIALPAQTLTTLFSFDGPDGQKPSGLIRAANGELYGTTLKGGAYGYGSIFEINPSGSLNTLYSFCADTCADGAEPNGVMQATDGNFYGTTLIFGGGGFGTVFRITPSGTLTTLYSFCPEGPIGCTDGTNPHAGLIEASDGNFYGTASNGGAFNQGTIFQISPSGTATTIYNFCSLPSCADGGQPVAGLIQASDGNLYGTTSNAGVSAIVGGGGTVFKVTLTGTFTLLHTFCHQTACPDGASPYGSLVQTADGNFFGATTAEGAHQGGTIFEMTPTGAVTTLHSFCSQPNCADGETPFAGLTKGANGNFYGTTMRGGASNAGTVFQVTPTGNLTTLHSFCSQSGCADGAEPGVTLVPGANGSFFGTTYAKGTGKLGTVFELSPE